MNADKPCVPRANAMPTSPHSSPTTTAAPKVPTDSAGNTPALYTPWCTPHSVQT